MSFKQLLTQLYSDAATWRPDQFLEPQRVETHQLDGLRSEARVRQHRVAVDEPREFQGTDTAPNPAELALAGLGASLEVTTRVFADYFGIAVERIATTIEGKLDLHGFLDLDPAVRSGFGDLRVTLHLTSRATQGELQRLLERVQRSCPVLDLMRGATPIHLTLDVRRSAT